MIYSMTGFSAADAELANGSLSVELRAVNHRYLDIQIRIPDELRSLEPALRERIAAQIKRGKVECRVSYNTHVTAGASARLNQPLLHQLAQWNREIREAMPAARELSVADILRWNGILESSAPAPGELHDGVVGLLQKAMDELNAVRAREGAQLRDFVLQRAKQINTLRVEISPRIPAAIRTYESKLRTRLLEALGNHDDERIRQEISLFAARIDVDEELSRLHTHLNEVERVLEKGGSAGKRLDFLMQELHREANTLGSKSADAEVSRASMEIKILIEQMREQIQNLE